MPYISAWLVSNLPPQSHITPPVFVQRMGRVVVVVVVVAVVVVTVSEMKSISSGEHGNN